MEVFVNDITYDVPFDLSQITLGKFIEYNEQYGRDLDKQLSEILAKKYEGDAEDVELNQSIDLDNHMDNEGLAWFSYWTGHDMFEVKDNPAITQMLQMYRVLRFLLKEGMEQVYELPLSFTWKDAEWKIADFKINPASEMDFNEIITSKEAMRQIYKVGKGKWDALPYLCAVYLRKKGESFQDEFTHEDSERMELFKELPLLHALQVAFFEHLCIYLAENFSVFQKSGGESKPDLIAYYDQWGWVDFLIEIARTKMFDIDGAGLDSVECAKKSKAYKVLIYASSERDKGIAIKNAYELKT